MKLSQEQIAQVVRDGTLVLEEENFTGAVRERINALTARAKSAEERLAELAAQKDEEQTRREAERQARETERAALLEQTKRAQFCAAAVKAGVIDAEAAYAIAKTRPEFASVEIDAQGAAQGVEAAVAELVKEKPYLVAPQKKMNVGSASNPGAQSPPAPETIAQAGEELLRRLRGGS